MESIVIRKAKRIALQPAVFVELFYWMFFLVSIFIKCLYFQFTTNLNIKPILSSFNFTMLMASFGVLLIISSFIVLIFNKKRISVLFIVDLFFSLLLIADTLYFRYYYNVITIPVLYQIGLVGSVEGSVKSLLKSKDIIYFLDIPFILAVFILVRLSKTGVVKINLKKRIIAALILIAAGSVFFFTAYASADKAVFFYDNNYVSKNLGVLYFHYYDAKKFAAENLLENRILSKSEKKQIDAFFKSKAALKGGEKYKGIAKDKNLIIVQVEALQEFLINKKINGKEITPNLNKLIKESLYFNNFYYQVAGGNTSDAEFLCNTSLYPLKEGAVYFRYPSNSYKSLPKMLKKQGYNTYAFHANNPSFWNRTVMYKTLGFDKFISYNDYIIDEFIGWGGWALSDTSFFRQSLPRIDTSKPFYGFLITLSSHHPFSYFEDYKGFNVGEFEKTYLGNYLKAANYADSSIGKFIDDLKKRGLYDNTLLVIYGDHYAIPKHQSHDQLKFLGLEYSELQWYKLQKVPLLIHYPGVKNGEVVATTGGEIDLLPTISNLMGMESPYSMGKDLLNTDRGYAVFRNGSFVTDDRFFLNDFGQAYDINSGRQLSKEEYQDDLKLFQNELDISDLIIKKDALKNK